jgi:putative transposase
MRVSRGGYAAWQGRPVSRRARQEGELLTLIREAHRRSRGTCGSPRIHQELRHAGTACGLNRAARIMRKHQITARPRAGSP